MPDHRRTESREEYLTISLIEAEGVEGNTVELRSFELLKIPFINMKPSLAYAMAGDFCFGIMILSKVLARSSCVACGFFEVRNHVLCSSPYII